MAMWKRFGQHTAFTLYSLLLLVFGLIASLIVGLIIFAQTVQPLVYAAFVQVFGEGVDPKDVM